MTHFDETSRWMEWSKNEFSHGLAHWIMSFCEGHKSGAPSAAINLSWTNFVLRRVMVTTK